MNNTGIKRLLPESTRLWLYDARWAIAMMHARRFRRDLDATNRMLFDNVLAPPLNAKSAVSLQYPEAFWRTTGADVRRAVMAVEHRRKPTDDKWDDWASKQW